MSEVKETIRERIARQMAEEDAKMEARRAEQEQKLRDAEDKTVEKYKKLAAKANKKAQQYEEQLLKLAAIESDYNVAVAETLVYQKEVVELGRESELIHVQSIHDDSADSDED